MDLQQYNNKSWTQLAADAPLHHLTNPRVFAISNNRYRGPPPIPVFRKIFPQYNKAHRCYQDLRDKGQGETQAFEGITGLLSSEAIVGEENLSFWKRKAAVHLQRLYKKRILDKLHHNNFSKTPVAFNIDHYAAGIETQQKDLSAFLSWIESNRDVPAALASYLSTNKADLQVNLEPFLAGLLSGRLRPLQSLEDYSFWSNDTPKLFRVQDASPTLDLDTVWGTAVMNIRQGTIYTDHRKSDPVPFQASYVSEFCRGISAEHKYVVNIPLDGITLPPPIDIEKDYHIYQQEGEKSVFLAEANIGTFGSVVDLHEGNILSKCYQTSY
jgi:hypothetical protein